MVAPPFKNTLIIKGIREGLLDEGKPIIKRKRVDWNGGGDFCGNSASGSTRTEQSDGEGWSRAREKRPPQWKSTIFKKRVCERFSPTYSLQILMDFFSALEA